MSVYAVADLHGQYNLWRQVVESLEENDILYILGDCADRGSDGWKIIKEALTDRRVIYIRGNHEQMLLDSWRNEWCDNYIWFCNGGYETFDNLLMDSNYEIYLQQLSRTKLSESYVNASGKEILLSHAGFTLMENNELPCKDDLLWDREHIDDACDWWPESDPNTYVVHGHTPVISSSFKRIYMAELNDSQTIIKYAHGHKICIDAGCFRSGKIAILNLDTFEERIFEDNELL